MKLKKRVFSGENKPNQENAESPLFWTILTVIVILFLYLDLCVACSMWIICQDIVSPSDMKNSSWLTPTAELFNNNPAIPGLIVFTIMTTGLIVSAIRASSKPLLISVILGLLMQFSLSQQNSYVSGIYNGTIKIGCYDWESKECQVLLGYSGEKEDFKTYIENSSNTPTPQYSKVIEKISDKPSAAIINFSNVPGAYYLMSPITAFHLEEVKKKLKDQKEEFERRKNPLKKEKEPPKLPLN